jgi:hypothetical protein
MDLHEILRNCTKYFQSISLYIKNCVSYAFEQFLSYYAHAWSVHILMHTRRFAIRLWTNIQVRKMKSKFVLFKFLVLKLVLCMYYICSVS